MSITRIIFESDNAKNKKVPIWAKTSFVTEDNTIYIPAIICGSEVQVVLSASWDGVPILQDRKHIYVSAQWASKEFPHVADIVLKIESRIIQHLAH